jgi:hypothetical protein
MDPLEDSPLDAPPAEAGDQTYRDQDRLGRHFGSRVLHQISGTGNKQGDDKAVSDLPSDDYFAGSLIPSAEAEVSGLSDDLQSKLSPSAIQAEFKVDPNNTSTLAVTISGNVYYRSFPTYEEQFEETHVELANLDDDSETTTDPTGKFKPVYRRLEFETSPIEIDVPDTSHFESRDVITASIDRTQIEQLTTQLENRLHAIDDSDTEPPIWRAPSDLTDIAGIALKDLSDQPISSDLDVNEYTGNYTFDPALFQNQAEDARRKNYNTLVDRISTQAAPFVPTWDVTLQCEFLQDDDHLRGTLTVENDSAPKADTDDYDSPYGADTYDTTLFDVTATLTVDSRFEDFTFERLDEDFRYDRTLPGHGTNCTISKLADDKLQTTYLPSYRQERYVTRDPDSFDPEIETEFEVLTDLEDGGLEALHGVAEQMEAYLTDTYEEYLEDYEATEAFRGEDREKFEADREAFADEITRFRRGIECLEWDLNDGDGDIARSFELMNETFVSKVTADDGTMEYDSWHLFQLVFMLRVLPDIASREYDRWSDTPWRADGVDSQNHDGSDLQALDLVDILWFPTGGGKTEAYLGLAIYNAFFDRKRGKGYGVTAWTRFPLRLLSLQQTQRIGELLMFAELHRLLESDIAGDGYFPFTLGYLVGSKNTPNKLTNFVSGRNVDSSEYLKKYHRYADGATSDEACEEVKIFPSCPVCGSDVKVRATDDLRLAHYCTADTTDCRYQRRDQPTSDNYQIFAQDELPVHIVDNELYRYAPTMIVGTIDKITAIGYERKSGHIYAGKMTHWCPDHGFASFNECTEKYGCHSKYGGSNSSDGTHLIRLAQTPMGEPYDIAPGIQIQDELHLLEESLGTFDSHFETFVDTYQRYNGEQRTKIVGATATIEDYDEQAQDLYLRKAERFPVEGPTVGENFYATTKDATRRHFVGIMPHNKTHINAVIQLNYFYRQELETLRQRAETASSPLPIIDDLGFETVTNNDDLLELIDLYETCLTYTISKRDKNRYTQSMRGQIAGYLRDDGLPEPNLAELTGDTRFEDVEDILDNLEHPPDDVSDRYDTIAATNMISHGVDVNRFNHMVFFGMPRQTAEYIQSSSRAGRRFPGVIFVCFNPARERDQSHYHLFEKYHEYLDRLVEPVPINRWSHFSVQRTLPSMIFGWILNQWLYETGERLYFSDQVSELVRSLQSGRGRTYGISINDSTQFQDLLERSYGRDLCGELPEAFREILNRERDRTLTNLENIQEDFASNALDPGPMISLRDIDERVPFVPVNRDNENIFDELGGRGS